ncbi:MAG: sigma-70 family RNA polymerase sigma factor [Planctomycetota bacterium]|nr:sigma-70 family RNA polymerase sigma factor [Planctomycetota bacterium]
MERDAQPSEEQARRPSHDMAVRHAQFQELGLPLADRLYAMALRLMGNAAQAEDLVQDTYFKAWQNFEKFELGTNFKAWIFKILTFLYRNERRSAKHREQTVDFAGNDLLEARAEGDPTVAVGLDWNKLYPDLVEDELKQALDRLSEDQRSVFLLVTLGDLSYQECAEALGVPIGTVMSRLFRARKILQDELTAYARSRGAQRKEEERSEQGAAR